MWEVSEKKNKQKNEKLASGGRSLKNECIVLYYVCMFYWVCSSYSTTDSESVSLQNPLHKIYSKILQKTSEVFLSFIFFLNMVTSAAVWASITTNMSNE